MPLDPANPSPLEFLSPGVALTVVAIGLFAGLPGGLLGIGGSVVMIPGLTWLLGPNQQLYQASAMLANLAVAVPAVLRHRRAGALDTRALRWMAPAAVISVVLGVALSNLFRGEAGGLWLRRVFAVLLAYVGLVHGARCLRPRASADVTGPERLEPWRALATGGASGLIGGLLGVGGGAVSVPMQQALMNTPLRRAIAQSSALMCLSAAVGALHKNLTLAQHARPGLPASAQHSLTLALLLAPSCIVGGYLGAALTHRLPLRTVRACFALIMLVSALRMAWG